MTGWAPFAVRWDGSASKVGYPQFGTEGPKRGAVCHSAEGRSWQVIHDILAGPRRASWTFTIGYDRIEQHYSYRSHCWHAGDTDDDGGVRANIELIGIEALGMVGEPLTPYQVDAEVLINGWCAEQEGRRHFARYPNQQGVWTLAEHNQVSDQPTACPSGRIPWAEIIRRLERIMPTDAQRLNACRILAECQVAIAQGVPLTPTQKAALRFLAAAA